jgi:hypothetical protein
VKKPAGITKEQWAEYDSSIKLALKVMQKALNLLVDVNFKAGEIVERDRIIRILEENKMHYGCARDCPQPCDAPSFLEFIALIKGEKK